MKGAFRFDASLRPRIDVGYRAVLNPVDRVVARKPFGSARDMFDRARMTPHNIPRFIQPPSIVPPNRLQAFSLASIAKPKGPGVSGIIARMKTQIATQKATQAAKGAIPSAATSMPSDAPIAPGDGAFGEDVTLPGGLSLPGWALPAAGALLLIYLATR